MSVVDAVAVMASAVKAAARAEVKVEATSQQATAKAVVVVNAVAEAVVASAATNLKKAAAAKLARHAWTSAAPNLKVAVKRVLTAKRKAVAMVAVVHATRVPLAPTRSPTATPRRSNKASWTPCPAQKVLQSAAPMATA